MSDDLHDGVSGDGSAALSEDVHDTPSDTHDHGGGLWDADTSLPGEGAAHDSAGPLFGALDQADPATEQPGGPDTAVGPEPVPGAGPASPDSFFADADGNGLPDWMETDSDGNGVPDFVEDPYSIPDLSVDDLLNGMDPGATDADGPGAPAAEPPAQDPDDGSYPSFDDSSDPYHDPWVDDQQQWAQEHPQTIDDGTPSDDNGAPADADSQYADDQVVHYQPDWQPSDFDGVGDPTGEAANWHEQQGDMSCAVVAQGSLISEWTGEPFNEDTYVQEAQDGGFFDPETGTYNTDIGKLLEMHGISSDQPANADINTLMDALEQGDRPIVGLNANEIWDPVHDASTDQPLQQDPPAGHAVVVTGVDHQPDGQVYVIVNDSGTPDGAAEPIRLDDFLNAWSDTDNSVTIAHHP